MRSHHDMGGRAAGEIIPGEHDYALWEKRVDALLVMLTANKLGAIEITSSIR